ncbi:hypothetical protein WJX72_005771 [[Myrmecia] bisecta]|uniref:Alpha N-terminal protein methyltransferase 1 n=1 Tax=[Myrmecia] bisecta TaxID=41462 RepID=A0AAW1PXL6_9CHLO
MSLQGVDTEGGAYQTPEELWSAVENDPRGKENGWYKAAVQYWDKQEASYNGVLGGFGHVSDADITESQKFLKKAFAKPLLEASSGKRRLVALDCGAGVGRVSEQLLLHHFHEVDLLEPSGHLLETARKKLCGGGPKPFPSSHHAVNFMQMGLQEFAPTEPRYDVLWIQWSLLYLTDDDAVALFERSRAGLKPDGIIVVKENICKSGFVVDKEDSSLTRSNAYMLKLFEWSNLTLLYNTAQRNFPKNLFQVRMYALKHKPLPGSQ